MYGLRTSSVLILDDEDEDALKIAKSLALRSIGAVLVPGAADELRPTRPLSGIRIAVLDIDLGPGMGNDMPSKIWTTKGVVDRLIDPRNGPYVAVVWTTNTEDYCDFKEALEAIKCPPVMTVMLEKMATLNSREDEPADIIIRSIEEAVIDAPPLDFANFWEQVVRDAGNDTLVSLALAEGPGACEQRGLALLAALLRSEASATALKSDVDSMRDLMVALNQILFDRVEARSASIEPDDASVVAPVRAVAQNNTGELTVAESHS